MEHSPVIQTRITNRSWGNYERVQTYMIVLMNNKLVRGNLEK